MVASHIFKQVIGLILKILHAKDQQKTVLEPA